MDNRDEGVVFIRHSRCRCELHRCECDRVYEQRLDRFIDSHHLLDIL